MDSESEILVIGDDYYLCQSFILKDESDQEVSLEGASITVVAPGNGQSTLDEDFFNEDYLKFDVNSAEGLYSYSITKDGVKYEATINWTEPVELVAVLQNPNPVENKGVFYYYYKIDVDVQPGTGEVYRIKPDSSIVKGTLIEDNTKELNYYLRVSDEEFTQLVGDHIIVIKKGSGWYKSVINYQEPNDD